MSIYLRTEKIIPDWTDYNGHMNLAFYIHLFDQGWDVLLDRFQMGGESAKNEKRSTFAVESHTKYIQEVKEGDEVDINLLFLDRDKKRFVYQLEIVSKSGNFRAATSEVCSLYVDLSIRKVIEMEDHKLKLVDDFIAENKNQFSPIEFYLLDKLKKLMKVAIIGSGIVGLTIAYTLSKENIDITIFEKERDSLSHGTGRNSGVIHSGIYYQPKTLRSTLCIRGSKLMIKFILSLIHI